MSTQSALQKDGSEAIMETLKAFEVVQLVTRELEQSHQIGAFGSKGPAL